MLNAHISSSGLRTLIDVGAICLIMLPLIYGALAIATSNGLKFLVAIATLAICFLYLKVLHHVPALHWTSLGICLIAWAVFFAKILFSKEQEAER